LVFVTFLTLGPGTNRFSVCISVCLTSLTPRNSIAKEMVHSPNQNTVGVCNQITLLTLYYISS